MSQMPAARLLIVDDEAALMTALCNTLQIEGYVTVGFTSAKLALARLREEPFDLLLTDLMMPEMDGIALLRAAQEIDRDLVGIVMTGHGTVHTAVKALQTGALDYVLKPFRLDNLLPALSRALTLRRVQAENIHLREAVSIYELSRAITKGLSHAEIVERTLDAAVLQTDAASAHILVPTQDGQELRVAGVRVSATTPVGGDADPAAASAPLPAVDARFPLNAAFNRWVEDCREQLADTDAAAQIGAVLQQPSAIPAGAVSLPIVAGGNFYGVLGFHSRAHRGSVNRGQVKALDVLASTAASAFEAASLLEQLRAMNRELEERVRARTLDLEASNADLEAFSYSVSHDLRAPLNAIDGFTQVVISDHAASLPSDARDLLDKVCAGAARMNRLIDDLLHLARFSRQPLETDWVSMTNLTRQVTAAVAQQWTGDPVELQIADLPDCMADASLLEHVLTNLVSNAYKFSAKSPSPRIEIGSLRQGADQVYFVKDNGVGFDMKYADRLFGVFQRLHPASQFPGTGVGLSIVHRIIRRHGGRAWAQSALQAGATFYFSLPRAQTQPATA